ncbi:MAG: SpoIID/LytB domain-containing protein [Clostridiales Family XIII bacterium]|jgi:SpoIID/LytB domain protein|nr:SpoIID/LytB domain-containing protein [Clostridiales Family XIII bacterium]
MKKAYKIAGIVCAAALIFVVPAIPRGTVRADALPVSDSVVRVHLSSYGTPSSIAMEATGSHTIADNGKALSGKFTVSVSGGKIKITAGSSVYTLDADVTIKAGSQTVANLIKINGNYSYAGDFRLLVKSGGIKIVNALDYETYCIGVLPYEMSNSWPLEALKAQAIAARTYAYTAANNRNRAAQEHDVVNTTSSQVYYGYNATNKNCIAAIKATEKQILSTSGGGLLYTFYSASNGGHTEYPVAAGVATSNLAYLPYKDDPYDLAFALSSTSYSAQLTLPKSFSASTLKTSTATAYTMLRNKLTSKGVDAGKLTGTVTVKSIKLDTPRYTNPNRVFTGADITLTVTDAANKTSDVTLSFECYTDGNGIKRPFLNDVLNLSNKSKFSVLYLKENVNDYLLASVRYGHAAGMSQIGAYQMAKSGKTYRDILTFYYDMGGASKLVTKSWSINNGVTTEDSTEPEPSGSYTYGTVSVSGANLNVRGGPSTSYAIIGSLKSGAAVTIISTSGSWHKIQYNGGIGYVHTSYVKLNSTTPPANWKYTDGKWYCLDSNGKARTGWVKDGSSWYYLGVNGAMVWSKWLKDGGSWYYLSGNGKMVAGKWFHDTDGSWYYLSGSGKMLTGKQKIGGKTYTFKANGVWIG